LATTSLARAFQAAAVLLAVLRLSLSEKPMKQLVAIVRPFLAEKIVDGLKRAPLESLSVREVKGYGRQKETLDQYSDSEYATAFLPKVEISLWVDDTRVDEVVQTISSIARTGRMGDGKIFIMQCSPPQE
jgi:nitrogen regulatory protein P-II 1